MKCCSLTNSFYFIHVPPEPNKIFQRLCCFDNENVKLPENINGTNFHLNLENAREFYYKNAKILCKDCPIPRNEEYLEKLPSKSIKLCLEMSHVCSLNCDYCHYNNDSGSNDVIKNETTKLIEENRNLLLDKLEVLVSQPFIKIVNNCGGEFFENKKIMDLMLKWKKNYNVEIETMTNLVNYDPSYPLDYIIISWHKKANLDIFLRNLDRLSKDLKNDLIQITLLCGNTEHAFHVEEAFELVKKHLSPDKFAPDYVNVIGRRFKGSYSYEHMKSIVDRTIDLGFKKSKFCSDHKYLYQRGHFF